MNSLKWLPVLALAAACGQPPADDASDTDDLSTSTLSMEMVRANPALAPHVVVPEGVRVNGRARPLPEAQVHAQGGFHGPVHEGDFLYGANQLGQFLQLADPAIVYGDRPHASTSRQPGDLFADDGKMTWTDVAQGYLGDCYFASSLSAVLFADKSHAIARRMIVPHTDAKGVIDSYTVTFFQATGRKVAIQVDPDLPHRNTDGIVFYMSSTQNKPGYEEWAPSLVEKAYATWHKSYNVIGNGGTAADAIFALTGKTTRSYSGKNSRVVDAIEAAGKDGRAQVACTYGDKDGVKYPVGIYSDHCYGLRGVRREGNSVFVQLRNPWGPGSATDKEPTEPPTADGVFDGLFDLPAADFQRLYATVDIVP